MDWVKLIIPLIAVAVWILSNLANQQKDIRRPPRVPLPPRPRDPLDSMGSKPPTKADDDNQYRAEMDRKREKKPIGGGTIARPRPRRGDYGSKPPPQPVVLAPIPQISFPRKPRATQSKQTAGEIYVPPPVIPVAPSEPIIRVGEPAVPVVKPQPVAIKNMLDLLKKKENLATVFLLKEILDLPVSKRSRRKL